ncbi:hypothetical protein ALC60_00030, partial [Trachymyrmex zeteki]
VQSVSEDSILLMLTENQSLKQQLERMHIIIKYYAHYPAVAEYLQNIMFNNSINIDIKYFYCCIHLYYINDNVTCLYYINDNDCDI